MAAAGRGPVGHSYNGGRAGDVEPLLPAAGEFPYDDDDGNVSN